ncbi:hypothetical protein DDE18_20965 [Nocardioides gansuensis]|uniref:Uncharacterized protein n=1 Tax=Nocardioides gansuensis TaxID=2138300 RepID=A0A2T8F579_9ACTN|nr:hypothetical protein [Nocardioides gansuensis]PVG80857.1 hypothetical protein DDE18_20965 [Nocardioides gansuensis]
MNLEECVASAIRAQTDLLQPAVPDLAVIRASAKTKSRRRAAIAVGCAVTAVVAVVAAGVSGVGRDRSDNVEPIDTPSSSPTPSTAIERLDTSGWSAYRSDRYDLEVGHPSDWTVVPASRGWRGDADSRNPLSPAHEAFQSPAGDVRVSVWSVPLDPGTRIESIADIEAWVEDYCEASSNTPGTGIEDRAVELCLEKRDCHPGLLVPFRYDVQAFFSGGIYNARAMTVVAVWRNRSHPAVAPYGGAQPLLEAFLSTMDVRPAQ